jgi:hypothetical protein
MIGSPCPGGYRGGYRCLSGGRALLPGRYALKEFREKSGRNCGVVGNEFLQDRDNASPASDKLRTDVVVAGLYVLAGYGRVAPHERANATIFSGGDELRELLLDIFQFRLD